MKPTQEDEIKDGVARIDLNNRSIVNANPLRATPLSLITLSLSTYRFEGYADRVGLHPAGVINDVHKDMNAVSFYRRSAEQLLMENVHAIGG